MDVEPLYVRALARRAAEERSARIRAGIERRRAIDPAWGRARVRKHPRPQVGDVVGRLRVIADLGRGHAGRADLRFAVECTVCGAQGEAFEFNLRTMPRCVRRRNERSHD